MNSRSFSNLVNILPPASSFPAKQGLLCKRSVFCFLVSLVETGSFLVEAKAKISPAPPQYSLDIACPGIYTAKTPENSSQLASYTT